MEYDRFSGTGRDKWHTNYLYVVANPANLKQDVSRGFNIENPTKIRKSTIGIPDRLLVTGENMTGDGVDLYVCAV